MARSTYTGGTATLTITVEHTWGSDESTARVDARRINGLPLIPFTVPADPDILRELGQALIGAADEFSPEPEPEDDVTDDDLDVLGATTPAERRVLVALSGTQPRTPADLKRRMPGATPVAIIRSLLDSLRVKGLAAVRMIPGGTGTTTTWVSIGAGVAYSDAERQASLEAAQAASSEAPEDTGLPLSTAERAVWYALRRSSGRTVATVAKAVERSERHTQALLESLEAQGYARQYASDAFGTLWRVAI